jgi:hypothetical protein
MGNSPARKARLREAARKDREKCDALKSEGRVCGNCEHYSEAIFSVGNICQLHSGGGRFSVVRRNNICTSHSMI